MSASYPFDDHGKSILMDAKYGYVAIHADKKSGVILGAECVGKDAGELIHSLSVGVGLSATVHDLLRADWYHPTLSEIWTYPLGSRRGDSSLIVIEHHEYCQAGQSPAQNRSSTNRLIGLSS